VKFLRGIGAKIFDDAADRFAHYKKGRVSFVDRSEIHPSGDVLGQVNPDGNVELANDLHEGDMAILAVHESRHLKGVKGGNWQHNPADKDTYMPYQFFWNQEYYAYEALPNPGPYAAPEYYRRLKEAGYHQIRKIQPLRERPQ
jgi:hypothetical protein